jgi:branched-chain amino acid transport system permease protein
MIALAWLIERLVLGRLVNQEGITLLMATLGITYFLDGFGQTLFGSDIYKLDVGLPKDPLFMFESVFQGGILVSKEDLYAAVIAAALVAVLSLFFQKTATGRALRAVADDHQAAQSIGIPLSASGSSSGGSPVSSRRRRVIWAARSASSFRSASSPGPAGGHGLTSVPGDHRRLDHRRRRARNLHRTDGGGIEIWFAYGNLRFLLVRPGLFGEDHRSRLRGSRHAVPETASSRSAISSGPADLPDPGIGSRSLSCGASLVPPLRRNT